MPGDKPGFERTVNRRPQHWPSFRLRACGIKWICSTSLFSIISIWHFSLAILSGTILPDMVPSMTDVAAGCFWMEFRRFESLSFQERT